MTQPWQAAMFTAMTANFVPILGPANQNSYDPQQLYNAALAIVAGVGAAALAFRLLPPLSPALRTRRLLALTLRDLRRLTTGRIPQNGRVTGKAAYIGRLSALPEQAEPLQRAQLVAALSVGTEIIRLRHIARRFDLHNELDVALAALAQGDSVVAIGMPRPARSQLGRAARHHAGHVGFRLRARGSILAMSEALLTHHAAYFDSGAAR